MHGDDLVLPCREGDGTRERVMHPTEEPSDERDPAAARSVCEEVDVEQVERLRALEEYAIGVAARGERTYMSIG